ncbi:MAG TPA: hypothetical protein VNO33_00115 [Kofleriaceae bacterium]|nr:hypothetical protein [Kofleriaceae bacterium]
MDGWNSLSIHFLAASVPPAGLALGLGPEPEPEPVPFSDFGLSHDAIAAAAMAAISRILIR